MSKDAINPNVPVNGESTSTTEMVAGDGPRTFDELDRALNAKNKAARDEKNAKEESPVEAKDEKSHKSKDLSSDADKGKKEKPEAKESKGAKEKEDESKKEEAPKPKKTLKYKAGENEAELDEDALFTAIINGKPEVVTARDLLNNYSGKTNWDKKYSESHRQAKEFEGKYNEVQLKIKSAMEEKDPNMRLWKMAEVAGMNPVQFKKFYLDDNMPLLEQWYSMSEEEKKSFLLEEENKYLKHQTENFSKADQERASLEKTQKEIAQLRQAHNVSEDDYWNTYESLAAVADQGKLEQDGISSSSQLTPKKVIEIVQKERLWIPASEALSKTQVPQEKHSAILADLVDMAHTNGLSNEDVAEIISELYGAKKTQSRIEEKVKQNAEFKTGKKEVPNRNQKDPLLFSDL